MPRYSLLALLAFGVASPALAEWSLDMETSDLSFVSIKAVDIAEVHHFTRLGGRISDKGKAIISIDLSSVSTGIEVRDERMQAMLFDIDNYPVANISAKIDMEELEELMPGISTRRDTDFQLELHGTESTISADIIITRLSETALTVSTARPIILSASSVGLGDGVEALRKIANLPSIGISVPVNFVLTFTR